MDVDTILHLSGFALYAVLFFLPFVQEDVAVVAAATASMMQVEPVSVIFGVVLAGLTVSDVWKYWLGYFARNHAWAHRFAEKKGVSVAGDLVRNDLIKTLFAARFIPGTRIPTYIACGFFKTPYVRFCLFVLTSAFIYVVLTFSLFHSVGAVAGEQTKYWLPLIAITIVLGYLGIRWLRHRNGKLGPMTPISDEPDRSVETTKVDDTHHNVPSNIKKA
ncbi:MAG: VTT domain-containing protein [Pseudomonadota bacterium]